MGILTMALPALKNVLGDLDDGVTVIIVADFNSDIIEQCRERLYQSGDPDSLGLLLGLKNNDNEERVDTLEVTLDTLEKITCTTKQLDVDNDKADLYLDESSGAITLGLPETKLKERNYLSDISYQPLHALEQSRQYSTDMNSKKLFDEKIAAMKAEQGKNVKMFSNEEYQRKMDRIKEVKMGHHRMEPQDYVLMRRFEVLRVERDGQILERLVKVDKNDEPKKMFVTYELLFDAILEFHVKAGKHTGRDITFKRLQEIYANITVQQVVTFIECCETCQQKKPLGRKDH